MSITRLSTTFSIAVFCLAAAVAVRAGERNEVRVLADFEDEKELMNFQPGDAVNLLLDTQNGVTRGAKCCHVVTKPGGESAFLMVGPPIQNWSNFDYLAVDVYTNHTQRFVFVVELWDALAKDYGTRCTFDDFARLHPGKNTILFPIAHAKRNNKEGREWEELEPKDKVALDALTKVKFILPAGIEGGECHLWIDNIRLLQEDAAGQRLQVSLPASAKAFDFGPKSMATQGFDAVSAGDSRLKGNVSNSNCKWPEALTGGGVVSGEPFEFETPLPDGEYCVWVSARKSGGEAARQFKLQVGGQVLCDETITDADYYGEKGIFRHLRKQYSQKPNALWLDFVAPVNPDWKLKLKVAGGKLNVASTNFQLNALVAMPASEEAAFNAAIEALNQARIKQFYASIWFATPPPIQKHPGDGACVVWTSPSASEVRPWSQAPEPRVPAAFNISATAGEHRMLTLCVTAHEELGKGDVEAGDLAGPAGKISASNIKMYYQNYRMNLEAGAAESAALLPWTKIEFEAGMTWAYVLWLHVPDDAKPGAYEGVVKFKPEHGSVVTVPVKVEVLPFKLIDPVPGSFGLYYGGWQFPAGVDQLKLWREMLTFMREIGLTATGASYGFSVAGLEAGPDGKPTTKLNFDDRLWKLVKEVGMGRTNDQRMWGDILGGGRGLSKLLGMQPNVDQDPGLELRHPRTAEYKELYKDMVRQAYAHFEALGIPLVFQAVDEPRAIPNPWNRNLKDTIAYLQLIREANPNIKVEEDIIGDGSHVDDNTLLVKHLDVLSTQGGPHAARMLEAAQKAGITLWIYNTSHSRFSFGFYLEKMGAKGHWEWDDCITGQQVQGAPLYGYPYPLEWHTPFCGAQRMIAYRAPYTQFPAGMVFAADIFELSEGITDYAYLATLKKLIEQAPADSEPASQARKFLETLKTSLPPYAFEPKFATPDALAAVGAKPETPLPVLCELWRHKVAEYIRALGK